MCVCALIFRRSTLRFFPSRVPVVTEDRRAPGYQNSVVAVAAVDGSYYYYSFWRVVADFGGSNPS